MSDDRKRGEWKKDKSERGIYRRGRTWYIRFADQDGKVQAERVGPSKALALRAYAKRKTEVAERRFFPVSHVGFDELIKDVIAEARRRRDLKRSSGQLCVYRYRIMGEWWKGRKASSIKPEEIDRKLSEHCRTPANFNRYRNSLSHAYRLGIQNRKVSENPARHIELKQENNTIVRFLDAREEEALRAAIRRRWPEHEPEFDLALHTGMRWSEQFSLAWAQVDLKRSQITLPVTKSGGRQYVMVNKSARAALETLRALTQGSEFVCLSQDHWVFRQWWEAALKESQVRDFRWHDLRHTFASRLVMAGVDIYTVSKLLRHETLKVTQRYAHLADDHLQQAVERLPGVTRSDTATQAPLLPMPRSVS